MANKNLFSRTLDYFFGEAEVSNRITPSASPIIAPNTPSHRVSSPNNTDFAGMIVGLGQDYKVVKPEFMFEVIPIIRKLMMMNPDVSQAIHNVVTLGNTGHKVFFDRNVSDDQQDRMRNHLTNRAADWASGQAGMDGLVSKMFSQILVGGALSNEWVPNKDLTGVESVILVKPEEIRFILDRRKTKYQAYQIKKNFIPVSGEAIKQNLTKLNPNTFKYYGLNGDTELPYGFPPYISILSGIRTQTSMNCNIDYVVDQLGLLGFLEALIQKPMQMPGETDATYEAKLNRLLNEAKTNVTEGFKDGTVVGFVDDHEFKFNSVGKNLKEIIELYKNNELQIASGLKQDASLWGRDYNTSETQITVVFMKMLSELRNIQNLIKHNLQFGYSMELRLAGFKFEYLTVEFKPSTIQDDLKIQQAREIKIRNLVQLYLMGTISENQFADELGYEAPDKGAPRVDPIILAGAGNPADKAEKKQTREKGKDASDKKVRDKNKPISK